MSPDLALRVHATLNPSVRVSDIPLRDRARGLPARSYRSDKNVMHSTHARPSSPASSVRGNHF